MIRINSLGVFFDKDDLSRPEMVDCCNEHDLCYDTCGSDKEECDLRFKKCLYNTCTSNQEEMEVLNMKVGKGGDTLIIKSMGSIDIFGQVFAHPSVLNTLPTDTDDITKRIIIADD